VKVLIADDEHLVRFGLRSMIEELSLGLTVVAEAANGEEMLTALARYQPDLCFVDIRMPGLNGLAAIRKARKAGFKTRWIILTSYAEFEYASEALALGVSSYLLKPAGPANLAEVLIPLIKSIETEKREASLQFEHSLVAALASPSAGAAEGFPIQGAWLMAVRCDSGADCSRLERDGHQSEALRQVRLLLAEPFAGSLLTAAWNSSADQFFVAAAWESADIDARNAAGHLKESLGILIKQSAAGSRRLTGLVSEELSSWEEFLEALKTLGRLSPQRILLGTGVLHPLAAVERRLKPLPQALLLLPEQIEAFLQTRERGEIPALEAQAQTLRDTFASVGSATVFLEAASRFLAFRTGLEPPAASVSGTAELIAWADGLVAATRAELPDLRRSADSQTRVVEKVDQYLKQNLRSEVRVPDIASVLGLSPNYLSSVYHKLTQSTISERLSILRLDLARELLTRPGSQVKEVASAVGYKSTRYFARLYHKRFGQYPSGR